MYTARRPLHPTCTHTHAHTPQQNNDDGGQTVLGFTSVDNIVGVQVRHGVAELDKVLPDQVLGDELTGLPVRRNQPGSCAETEEDAGLGIHLTTRTPNHSFYLHKQQSTESKTIKK